MSISITEIAVVFVVALLLFGPEQLPQIARQLGKLGAEFRKISSSVRREWYNAVYPPAEEIRREFRTEVQSLRSLTTEIKNLSDSPPKGETTHTTSSPRTDGEVPSPAKSQTEP